MKASLLLVALASLLLPSGASAQLFGGSRGHSADGGSRSHGLGFGFGSDHSRSRGIMFGNRSDHTVSVYRAPLRARLDGGPPMPRAQPLLRLAPGQAGSVPAETGQEFVVTAPDWSRPVEAITAGTWSRRVFVSEDDLHAIGTRRYSTTFDNRSGGPVIINQEVDGNEVGWVALSNGESRPLISYERQQWVVRDGETGDVLQRATTPAGNAVAMIHPRRMAPGFMGFGRPHGRPPGGGGHGGHGGHGQGHGQTPGDLPIDHVTLTITNTGHNPIAVYKKTPFGGRKFGTIGGGRSGRVETAPGEVWRLEDAVTYAVLQTIVVPDDDPHCAVSVAGHRPRPPAPPALKKVKIRVYNDTPEMIYVYKRKDDGWKYTKRINAGRYYNLEFYQGQQVSIRHPRSKREIEQFAAPSRSGSVRIQSHGDYSHGDHSHARGR